MIQLFFLLNSIVLKRFILCEFKQNHIRWCCCMMMIQSFYFSLLGFWSQSLVYKFIYYYVMWSVENEAQNHTELEVSHLRQYGFW